VIISIIQEISNFSAIWLRINLRQDEFAVSYTPEAYKNLFTANNFKLRQRRIKMLLLKANKNKQILPAFAENHARPPQCLLRRSPSDGSLWRADGCEAWKLGYGGWKLTREKDINKP